MERDIERLLRGGQFMSLLDAYTKDIRNTYQLKSVDLKILYYISKHPDENTSSKIQSYFSINKGYISQTVDRLIDRKLIKENTDCLDHRYIHYTITQKANSLIEQMDEIWERINQDVFEGISEKERKTFQKIARKVEENILKRLK